MNRPQSPLIEAHVEALSTDGRGILRVEGRAYFVAGGLPGDRIRVQLDSRTKPPSATITERIAPSPQRVEHPCPHAYRCTGSPWGALDYAAQLEQKQELVRRTLHKMIGEVNVLPCVPSPRAWNYRNRVALHIWRRRGNVECGFMPEARQPHGIAVATCHLALPDVAAGVKAVSEKFSTPAAREFASLPVRLQIQQTKNRAGVMLVFPHGISSQEMASWADLLADERLAGGVWFAVGSKAGVIDHTISLRPSPLALPMQTTCLGHSLDLLPALFCQTNSAAAALVEAQLQKSALQTFSHVWDLYGGFGTLGLAVAGTKTPVTVFEIASLAHGPFDGLCSQVGNPNGEFVEGDLLTTFADRGAQVSENDLIILDPPRSGVHPDILHMIGASRTHHIAYLSCNPAKLARDLAVLKIARFEPIHIEPFDFFPHTPAIEVLAILKR